MKQRVLFLCTGNSARSQMAEALLRHMAGGRFEVVSAGTSPAGLNPMTVVTMQEMGIDVRHHLSKHVEEFVGQSFTYVITVCDRAKESCPVLPAVYKTLHWSFDDPAAVPPERRLGEFRRVRDEIAKRIGDFLSESASPPRPVS